ncbi:PAQR family membrane homeostasis protein TrhA [Planctomicrobium piriforme]|uniref:Hemolysin III n=1 Tax=Planctomicrobium piriforme TaxID=1576369 RepID=A0A1I3EQB1_9PLAN|nr:hemolysin III family protein [Planctomicrobium piriforme]SFI01030.1 hemolysin III [Planctomicrobium piriforme]
MLTNQPTLQDENDVASVEAVSDNILPDIVLRPGEDRPVDEIANFITHGLGFLLSIVGSIYLMTQAVHLTDNWLFAACIVYCVSLVGLYGASMLSHAFYDYRRRRYYRMVDQACIFMLIAGTFTPFAAAYLTEGLWPLLTILVWGFSFLGVYQVLRWGYLSAAAQKLYLALGWLTAAAMPPIVANASPETVNWAVAGGLLYTVGTMFLWYDRSVRYFHATWHTFVIAGSTSHYLAILYTVWQRSTEV